MKDPVACESCTTPEHRVLIRFVRVHGEHGLSWMPVNAEPDPAGNVAVGPNGTGRVLADDQKPVPAEVLYMPHFATCVTPAAHRKRHRQRRHEARAAGGQPPRRPQPGGQTLFGGGG